MKQQTKDRSTASVLASLKRLQASVEARSKAMGLKPDTLSQDELEAMFRNQLRMNRLNKR
jgi:lambda repressor-like predicted transcriptional regulator